MAILRATLASQLFIPLLVFSSHAFAQSGAALLTINFAERSSQFHVGETIPIELSFTASVPGAYDMSTRNYDRSGRLDMEQFHVNPAGRDPLQQYYAVGAFIGGGLGSDATLNDEPRKMVEDLNEWVALDKPGHYTIYITTSRVSERVGIKSVPIEVKSNSLDFDIIEADPEWQEQTVAAAVSILESGSSTEDEKLRAIRTLRFLDSPGSIRELIRQMGNLPEGRRFDCIAGLASSQHKDLAIQELERNMAMPDVAITSEYLYTLARLKVEAEQPPLPPYPKGDEQQQKVWQEGMQQYENKLKETENSLFEKTATLVSGKQGRARAETVKTLLTQPTRDSHEVQPLMALPDTEVASAFLALSAEQQWDLLSTFWARLQVPAMVDALEKVVSDANVANQMLRNTALQRLYELSPTEATPFIIEEIRHPRVDAGIGNIQTLAVLPQQTRPDFDEILAARLERKNSNTRAIDAQLVGRYSTKAILPRVKTVYESIPGEWDCMTEDGFITYFLRVDPQYGIRHAMPSTCMTQSIAALVRMKRWNEVESRVIAQLDSPDLWRGRDASETLAKVGSPKAESAMWARLARFHEQWKAREQELEIRPSAPRTVVDAVSFQFGLIESLIHAQGWLLSDEQVTELESLALGSERDNVKQYRWHSPIELNLDVLSDGQLHANINNQYFPTDVSALRAKLAQYPSGTTFNVTIFGEQSRLATTLQSLQDVALQHGLTLEISSNN